MIKRFNNKKMYYIMLLFIGIVAILFHVRMNLNYGDVVETYGLVLDPEKSGCYPKNGTVFGALRNFVLNQYTGWSSRTIIEVVMVIISSFPNIVWHVLDIAICIFIVAMLCKLLNIQNKKSELLILLTCIATYSVIDMSSAGWIATTMNYSWPLAMLLFLLVTIQKILKKEQIGKFEYLYSILACIYSCNNEQITVFMTIISFSILLFESQNKCFQRRLIPYFIITILEFLYIAISPGNAYRREFETNYWFPDYANYHLFDKIYLGYSTTINNLFYSNNLIVLFFLVALMINIWTKYSNGIIKIVSAIPVVFIVFVQYLSGHRLLNNYYVNLLKTPCYEGRIEQLTGIGYFSFGVSIILVVSVLISFWHAFVEDNLIIFMGVFIGSIASRLILGFSASIYVSGYRTFLLLEASLIFFSTYLIARNETAKKVFLDLKVFVILFDIMLIFSNIIAV